MDHYETLEVSRNASPEVIRAAYKSLMQRLHPDKHPEGEARVGRAAQIANAYEVLSNADRRAAYDLELRQTRGPGAPGTDGLYVRPDPIDRRAPRRGAGRQGKDFPGGSAWPAVLASRAGIAWWVVVFAVGLVWAIAQWNARKPDPQTELAALRQTFASPDVTEEERRALFARKPDILAERPELLRAENAEKAEEMAARTFALLNAPLVVRLNGGTSGGAAAEITIERISLLIGTFDAQRHLAHLSAHRERLISSLSARLAKEDPARLASQQAEPHLKKLLLDAIVSTLGTDPAQAYPSTYFESPGRYGVVDLVLPAQFKLVSLGSLSE